jgi:hypothetical protein
MFFGNFLKAFAEKMEDFRFFVRFWFCAIAFGIMLIVTNIMVFVGYGDYAHTQQLRNVGDAIMWIIVLLAAADYRMSKKYKINDSISFWSFSFVIAMLLGCLEVPILSPINSLLCSAIAIFVICLGARELTDAYDFKKNNPGPDDPPESIGSPS